VRILITDDHPLVLIGMREALDADGGFEIVGEAYDCARVVPLVAQTSAQAVLLDFDMPGMSAFECLDRVRERYRDRVKVIVIGSHSDPAVIESVFRHGGAGYIVKTVDVRDLGPSIRQALDGTAYHAFGLPAINDDTVARDAGLSERETEILRAVARGLSNKAISRELWVTEQTVKFHLTNIYRKLEVSNRTEAARWALAHGMQIGESTPVG
jgi:DNA-binding NarL/FixJ family response regulator